MVQTTNADYTVYYKGYDEFKVIDKVLSNGDDNVFTRNLSRNEKSGSKRTDLSLDSKKISDQRTTTSNDKIFNIYKKRRSDKFRSDTSRQGNSRNNLESEKSDSFFNAKYSITDNQNTNLKEQQLDIILKENPMKDDYHTGIRTIEDIKTFQEVLQEDLDGAIQDLTPDFKLYHKIKH